MRPVATHPPVITINVTAHTEGYYLHKSIKSAELCCKFVEVHSHIETVIHINLDSPDELTLQIAERAAAGNPKIEVFINDFHDIAASRNFLIQRTSTKYCVFMDGDDLFTENFIQSAYTTALAYGKPCVVAAENIIKFGAHIDPVIFKQVSTIERPEIKSAEFETNLYVSQNFVVTELFKNCEYESNNANYGFEDWHWNTKVIDAGYEFLVATGTSFFYRQKFDDKSLLKQHTNSNTVIRKTNLFQPDRYKLLPYVEYMPQEEEVEEVEPVVVTGNPVKRVGSQALLKISSETGIPYRLARKSYRVTQTTLAPLVHKMRGGKSQPTEPIQPIIEPVEVGGIQPYIPTDDDRQSWNRLNTIEPLIRFDSSNMNSFSVYRYTFEHSLATSYHWFCEQYAANKFTDIIFVPWISIGGADLAMLDLAKSLTSQGRKVLFLTTNGVDSHWRHKAEAIEGVTFIQSHDKIFRYLDHRNIKLLFLRVIQNWNIQTVTVMNSAIGFELMDRYGRAIKDAGCRIIVHNYAFPLHEDLYVEAFPTLASSLEFVDYIAVDSRMHRAEVVAIYGLSQEKVFEVPLVMTEGLNVKTNGITKKVLYANRLAREKQPQVAIEAVNLLQSKGISMDLYGAKDEAFCAQIQFDERIEETPNVLYKKTNSGPEEFNFNDYDICFLPSLYEGVPRIVLDSIKANLFIICTDAGGLSEVVQDNLTGRILPITASPQDFADAILDYYKNPQLHDLVKRSQINQKIIKQHSFVTYSECVQTIYLDTNVKKPV